MIKSVICDLLGIERPIFQGGMAWIADAKLAAAVSNAGGLGLISSINFGTEAVREEIKKARELTDKPFGVNIMLAAPNAAEIADMVVEEGVKILTTGAGSPAPYVEKWKAAGIKFIPVVASVAYAIKMEELGATAVIAEGAESGGHIGDNHTMALVPQVVDAVHIPVLAAGGIFDGRGAAAAFMLGACGVQVGTRFLIADECHVHENYKERLIKATDVSTMVTGKSLGDAVRCLKTPFSKKFFKMEYDPAVPKEEVLEFGKGSMRKAVFDGDLAGGSFLAGEVAGMIKKKETVKEIVDDIMNGAEKLLKGAPNLIA
jgi:enoyl-[acyl-carrier protein] reductase II